jgi:AraC family transcriptional regulator
MRDLLENVLTDIEKGIGDGINSVILAEKYALSEGHLRKLFRSAFKQSLGGYIRSRRLTASLDDLFKTNSKILDIALEYNFDYEQSYINAFKREFGITPGNFRKSARIVKVTPPLNQMRYGFGLTT